jgi:hypothetical protein
MPRKDFAAFTRLDASDVNTYLMDQSVQTFSGTATRSSAITTPVEGMMTYLSDLDRYDTYNGSSHVPAFGLTLVKSQTVGSAVTSVVVNNAFSADYDDYKIFFTGGVSSVPATPAFQLGASTTGYYYVRRNYPYAGGTETINLGNNASNFNFIGSANTNQIYLNIELTGPFLTTWTGVVASSLPTASAGFFSGAHQVNTSYSGFTVTTSTGTLSGGRINVYGYKKVL